MSIFDKWAWIKRNWSYIVEEAYDLELVFVGGTALNIAIFKEYRASEDIDLYDINADSIGSTHEKKMTDKLSDRLKDKGFKIKSKNKHTLYVGPNIKVDVFNNQTSYKNIEKKTINQIEFFLFDIQTITDMKMNALLCRTFYDPRDLLDLYILKKEADTKLEFPDRGCEVIEKNFNERLKDIINTSKKDLLIFQTKKQLDKILYEEFVEFRSWIYEWLSGFC